MLILDEEVLLGFNEAYIDFLCANGKVSGFIFKSASSSWRREEITPSYGMLVLIRSQLAKENGRVKHHLAPPFLPLLPPISLFFHLLYWISSAFSLFFVGFFSLCSCPWGQASICRTFRKPLLFPWLPPSFLVS